MHNRAMPVQTLGLIALGVAQLSILALVVLRASDGRLSLWTIAFTVLTTSAVTAVLVVGLSGDLIADEFEVAVGLVAGVVALGAVTTVAYLHGKG